MMVSGVPSMHICLDFVMELFSQPQIEKQVCVCVCVCVCGVCGVCVCGVCVCVIFALQVESDPHLIRALNGPHTSGVATLYTEVNNPQG